MWYFSKFTEPKKIRRHEETNLVKKIVHILITEIFRKHLQNVSVSEVHAFSGAGPFLVDYTNQLRRERGFAKGFVEIFDLLAIAHRV